MLHRKSVLPFFITIVIPHPSSSSSLSRISPSRLPSSVHPSYACPFYYFPPLFNFFLFLFRPVSFFLLPSLFSPFFIDTIIPSTSLIFYLPAHYSIWLWSGQHWFNSLQEHGLSTKIVSRQAWATTHLPHQWLP